MLDSPEVGFFSTIRTSCWESRNGNGRSRIVFTTLKTATFAPIPRARISTAINVKERSRRNLRNE